LARLEKMNTTNSTSRDYSKSYPSVAVNGVLAIVALVSFFFLVLLRNFEPVKGRRTVSLVTTFLLCLIQIEITSLFWLDKVGFAVASSVSLALLSKF
jgi:hypothetical protein